MNILICANEKFALFSKELINSIVDNNKNIINIYLMYSDLNNKTINKLKKFIKKKRNTNINFIKVKKEFLNNLPKTNKTGNRFFGIEAYYRIFAQFYLPDNIDRILYLDIDIICLGDFSKLYQMDFNNNYYIGCRDLGATLEDIKRIDLYDKDKYINSGVLLINLKLLRKNTKINELVSKINSLSTVLEYPDQDSINKIFYNKIGIVSNKYNFTLNAVDKKIKNSEIILLHFAGSIKGWSKNSYKLEYKYMINYFKYNSNLLEKISIVRYSILRLLYLVKLNFM